MTAIDVVKSLSLYPHVMGPFLGHGSAIRASSGRMASRASREDV